MASGQSKRRGGSARVLVMVSATGANLTTLLDLSFRHPELIDVALVASDRPAAPGLDVARRAGVPTWPGSFTVECGRWSDCHTTAERSAYRDRARAFHDRLCLRVEEFENRTGPIDLVVLAYHRWIHGALLEKFAGRMINQHPGDLADLDMHGTRSLIGLDPVGVALRRGDPSTRTSTFFVDDTPDGGAVIVRGPAVHYTGPRPPARADLLAHEMTQKRLSDRPALTWAVTALVEGRVTRSATQRHPDGSPVVLVDGRPTSLGGQDLDVRPAGRSAS